MGGLTSKPKVTTAKPPTRPISDIDRAVLDLKNARDRLQRYRKKLDDDKLFLQAKKAKEAGKTERALGLLRLRKFKQAQAASCEAQLLNVLQMVETIDSKQNDAAVLLALAAGKDSLKKMHEETTVDHVLELMDQIAEEIAVEQEITDILQGVPTLSPADEDAVEAEWEAMVKEMNMTGETTTTTAPDLPAVPTNKLPTTEVAGPIVAQTTTVPAREARVAVPG
jgi:charged multivesicular body protein 6